MKRLLGNTEISAYTAGSAKTFVLATVAVLLVGCGGGDDSSPAPRTEPSESTIDITELVCFLVSLLNPACFDDNGGPLPGVVLPPEQPQGIGAVPPVVRLDEFNSPRVTISWDVATQMNNGDAVTAFGGSIIHYAQDPTEFWSFAEQIQLVGGLINANIRTWTFDLPMEPGTWSIMVSSLANGRGSPPSNVIEVVVE